MLRTDQSRLLALALPFVLCTSCCATCRDDDIGDNRLCSRMQPVCISANVTFPAGVDSGTAEPGNEYQCLRTRPNPAWYYVKVATAGKLEMALYSDSDIDFAMWGPYASVASASSACSTLPRPTACSNSSNAYETIEIPSSAAVGEVCRSAQLCYCAMMLALTRKLECQHHCPIVLLCNDAGTQAFL